MPYSKFTRYNVVGAFIWVFSLVLLGYFFGNLTFVKNNFETVILAIIVVTLLPIIFEIMKLNFKKDIIKK